MSTQLYPEDCHAIDLLLDQGTRAVTSRLVSQSDSSIDTNHLAAVQRVLSLLEFMPAPIPPADLIKKTLARIDSAPQSILGTAELPMMHIRPGQQPLA